MFSARMTSGSTEKYSDSINRLRTELETADAVVIGAGAGLSTSAGLTYSGERFNRHFGDFREKYGITDMYSGGFYPFSSLEEYWGWWSRHIWYNRYDIQTNGVYGELLGKLQGKEYFVITTNVDHMFQTAGFDKARLFYTQGDYGLFQCSRGCHQRTYDNRDTIRSMIERQKNMQVPAELIPYCPVCGAPMVASLRADGTFVQDEGWHAAKGRYEAFLKRHEEDHVLYLELGVGGNTPVWIKYPFWKMTAENRKSFYACINLGEAYAPEKIADRSVCIDEDISEAIRKI